MNTPFVLRNLWLVIMPRVKGFNGLQVRQREHLENALAYLELITQDLKLVQLRIRQAKKRTGLQGLLDPADEIVIQLLARIEGYRQDIVQAISLISIENDGNNERKPS